MIQSLIEDFERCRLSMLGQNNGRSQMLPKKTKLKNMDHKAKRAFNKWRRMQKDVNLQKAKLRHTTETKVPYQQPKVNFMLPPKRRLLQPFNCYENVNQVDLNGEKIAIKIEMEVNGCDYMDHKASRAYHKWLLEE